MSSPPILIISLILLKLASEDLELVTVDKIYYEFNYGKYVAKERQVNLPMQI